MSVFNNFAKWLAVGAVTLASFGKPSFAEESCMPPNADYVSKTREVVLEGGFVQPPRIKTLVNARTYHNRKDRVLYLDVIVLDEYEQGVKDIEIHASAEDSTATIVCPNYIELDIDRIMQRGKTRAFDLLGKEKSSWQDLAKSDKCRIIFGTLEDYSQKLVDKDANKVPLVNIVLDALGKEARRKATEIKERTSRELYERMSDFHKVSVPDFVPKPLLRKWVGYSHKSWRFVYGTQEGIEIRERQPEFLAVLNVSLIKDNVYQGKIEGWVVPFEEENSLEKYVLAEEEIPAGMKLADKNAVKKLYGQDPISASYLNELEKNPRRLRDIELPTELDGTEAYGAAYSDGVNRTLSIWGVKIIPGQKTPDKISDLTKQSLDNEILAIYKNEKGDEYVLIIHDLPRYAAFQNNKQIEEVRKSLDSFYKRNNLKPVWRNKALDFDFIK